MRTMNHILLTSVAAVAVLAVAPAEAAAQIRRFDVPAQSAQTGIPQFARQAGIQILAPQAIVDGLKVNRVKGTMHVAVALRQLLAGTDLIAVDVGGAMVVKRRPAGTQAAVTPAVTASAAVGADAPAALPAQQDAATGRWQLRLWWKPFVTLIWLGGVMIALGGALALLGREKRGWIAKWQARRAQA